MPRLGLGRGLDTMGKQFAPVFGTVSRNFTTLASAGSKHITIVSKTYSGAFVIEYYATFTGSATSIVLGNSATSTDFLGSTNTGFVRLQIDASNLTTATAKLDSKYRHVKVERDGSDNITVTVAGFSPENIGVLAGDFTFDLIGIAGFGNGWSGIIANMDINGKERFYKLDETWDGPSTVAVDSGSDGSNGTAVNITSSDSENFNFDGSVSPNTWTNDGETIVLEVAGT